MQNGSCALAMATICDPEAALHMLAKALTEEDAWQTNCNFNDGIVLPPQPEDLPAPPEAAEMLLPIGEALARPGKRVSLRFARDRICQEYVYAYPPGIPLLLPGQRITAETLRYLKSIPQLRSSRNLLPKGLFTVSEL
jgi:hypothetical protein